MTDWRVADLGTPVATGRTSQIFAVPGRSDRVLKLFLPGIPRQDAEAEAERTAIAAAAGLTTVRCHGDAVTVEDRVGLELDRLHGISLTRVGEKNPLRVPASGRTLGELHARMHEVAAPGLPEVRTVVAGILDTPPLAFLSADERALADRMLQSLPEGDRLLHLDFHPENVFTTPAGGYAIIDWQTAVRGAPAADVAESVFILNDAELWPGTPALKRLLVTFFRRSFFDAYIDEYRRRTGCTDAEIAQWRLPALVLRLGWDIASERDQLRSAVRAELATGGERR